MSDKATYQSQVEAQFNQLASQIAQLRTRAASNPSVNQELAKITSKQSAVQSQLAAIRGASESSWQGLRGGCDAALNDLRSTVQSAMSKFS